MAAQLCAASSISDFSSITIFVLTFLAVWQGKPGYAAVAPAGQFGTDLRALQERASVLVGQYGSSSDFYSSYLNGMGIEDLLGNGRLFEKMLPAIKAHLQEKVEAFWHASDKSSVNIPICEMHLLSYADALLQAMVGQLIGDEHLWAIEMLDATGKIPSGLLRSNVASLGDFDECLGVRASVNISFGLSKHFEEPKAELLSSFKGQHCTLRLLPLSFTEGREGRTATTRTEVSSVGRISFLDLSAFAAGYLPRLGVCVPSSCSSEKLQELLVVSANATGFIPLVFDTNCFVDEQPSYAAGDILVM